MKKSPAKGGALSALEFDAKHIWHPYSAIAGKDKIYQVQSANGCLIQLADGRQLVDGIASWWCAIHGYNHPVLNRAITEQLPQMAHVMFGSLTHRPAIDLSYKLLQITPPGLDTVFFCDSGSIAVEVAMKMALQYFISSKQSDKNKFISLKQGYHGDSFGAMSVCDPINGMHNLFAHNLAEQFFIPSPPVKPQQQAQAADMEPLKKLLEQHHQNIAAMIVEPLVQNAGGINFYSSDYLQRAYNLCKSYKVLFIADEIATGFGRTGSMFACEQAAISPDIMCVGKALSGGYLSMGATLCSRQVAAQISDNPPGVFMHGPTFMANPLACKVATASIDLLLATNWSAKVATIGSILQRELNKCAALEQVREVRVFGAIGCVEVKQNINLNQALEKLVAQGVWLRPFRNLYYLMPAYTISEAQLIKLCAAIYHTIAHS